jgi:hypothetical protein
LRYLCGTFSIYFLILEAREMRRKGFCDYVTDVQNVLVDTLPFVMILSIMLIPMSKDVTDSLYIPQALAFFLLNLKLLYFAGFFREMALFSKLIADIM